MPGPHRLDPTLASGPSVWSPRWRAACLLLIVLVAWFAGIGSHPLYEPDEGRYAEVARQMFATGDWVMPRFDGFRFYDKPPLQYWATALAYHVFGVQEWSARLWGALSGLLCVAAIWYAGRRVWGARHGRLAALVGVGSLLIATGGHVNTLDMGVTAFLSVALGTFLIAQHGSATERARRWWLLATWLAMALGILSKGLIAVVLPGASLCLYLLWQRDAGLLRRLQILPGVAILLLVAAPWFVLLARRDSQFLSYFFIHEHLGRFLSKVVDRNHPWWYYLPIIVVGLLPWTAFLSAALRRAWSRSTLEHDGATRLVLIWSAVVFVFFSWSGAKLPLYILPLFPALSLLIAGAIASMPPRAVARRLLPVAVLGAIVAAVATWLPHTPTLHGSRAAYVALCNPFAISALLLAAGAGIGAAFAWRDHVDTAIAAAALGGLLFTQGLLQAYQRMGATASALPIATRAQPYLSASGPVYAVQDFARGLPFYLRRQVTLVDERPYDMRAGMDWDPQASIPDVQAFATAWARHPDALAIMPERSYIALSGQGLPMRIVASVDDIRIVRHPAPSAASATPPLPR